IFAPFLGYQAAGQTLPAILGFCISAVVFPIASVIIISRYKNASQMISTIHPVLANAFMTIVYLLIGPCIAIPRTASTSFAMFGWLLPSAFPFQLLYSCLFFGACFAAALHPNKLKDILGKVMGPILVAMVLILCISALLSPSDPIGTCAYTSPLIHGLKDGYQTMDILAAFCFTIVISLNIQSLEIPSKKKQRQILLKAAFVAGFLLTCLYGLLAACGMKFSGQIPDASNGAQVLSWLASLTFGKFGAVFISMIFLAACFNVCSGLLSCCSEYFHTLAPKISYRNWLILFTASGILVSVQGLDWILAISAPVLSFICPAAIVLLIWGLVYSIRHKTL
ncbi:MAG: branched-chain amino acid transport system II carrier protein, partial [Ileibacterium sp.]|nr:branched-chain amino acid transport system II carrier protein [Ileibacterium sp.]